MEELAKWAWIILICILFAGPIMIWVAVAAVVFCILIAWLKPEWLGNQSRKNRKK